MYKQILYGFVLFGLLYILGCSKDANSDPISLQEYLDDHSELVAHDELIACAAGGQADFLADPEFPLSLFLKPHYLGVSDIRYYESSSPNIDPEDLSLFIEKEAKQESLFNGFLHRFKLPPTEDTWARVSFIANDTLWYCKAIRFKFHEQASIFAPELCSVDLSTPVEPLFQWQEGNSQNNIIFFQVLSDQNGSAISGTYTTDPFFQFYNTSNVVLNVTHPGPTPVLEANKQYQFTLMGVSTDNWVNLIIQKAFTTE